MTHKQEPPAFVLNAGDLSLRMGGARISMVAVNEPESSDVDHDQWSPILDRMRHELESAARSKMFGELTLTVTFVDGVAMAEKIGVVKSRKLMKP